MDCRVACGHVNCRLTPCCRLNCVNDKNQNSIVILLSQHLRTTCQNEQAATATHTAIHHDSSGTDMTHTL